MEIAKFVAKLVQVIVKYIRWGLKCKKNEPPIETVQTAQAEYAKAAASTLNQPSTPKKLPPIKPPKPSRKCINDFGVDGSFMLCGDFVESKSQAMEVEILYVYVPDCGDDFVGYSGSEPYFMITSGLDGICCSYDDFVGINVDEIIKFEADDETEFYAEIDYHGDRMALYNYTRYLGDGEEYFALCMVYGNDYVGTEYEKHFLNVLKEAAETYRETITV